MFYTVSKQGHKIVDLFDTRPTLDDLKALSEALRLDLYVIVGERIGLVYERLGVPEPLNSSYEDSDGMYGIGAYSVWPRGDPMQEYEARCYKAIQQEGKA